MSDGPRSVSQRHTKRPSCTHAPVARECHNGYDITCGDCEALIGRVAIFPAAVFGRDEARELLGMLGDAGEGLSVRGKLTRAAERQEVSRV